MARGCFSTLRSVVFLSNLFLWLAGLGVFSFGLWLRFDPAIAKLVSLHNGSTNFHLISYLLIASGLIMSIIGFLGCCGAWRLNQCMLVTFFIILVIVFCLQLGCAILAYTQQDFIRRYIDNSMHDIVQEHYAVKPEYAELFDRIQSEFECCGVRSYRDWLHSSWARDIVGQNELGIGRAAIAKVPRSCCNTEGLRDYPTDCGVGFDKLELWTYEPFLHLKGCSDALYESAYRHLGIVIGICVILGILQLIGLFFSMLLCCWINSKERQKSEH